LDPRSRTSISRGHFGHFSFTDSAMYSLPSYMTMENSNSTPNKRDNTTPSCAVCQRRKVKCNRVYPCAPCQKTGIQCEFPEPKSRHRQKRRKITNEEAQAQAPSLGGASAAGTSETARLVSDGAGVRYVNNHLWNALPTSRNDGSTSSTQLEAGSTRSPEQRSGKHDNGSYCSSHTRGHQRRSSPLKITCNIICKLTF